MVELEGARRATGGSTIPRRIHFFVCGHVGGEATNGVSLFVDFFVVFNVSLSL